MSSPGPAVAFQRPDRRRYFIVTLLISLLALGLTGLVVWTERQHEDARAEADLYNLALLLVDDVSSLFARTESLIHSADDYYTDAVAHGGIDAARFNTFLDRQLQQIPAAMGVMVLGPDGVARFGSRSTRFGVNLADRAYFIEAREGRGRGLIFDGPLQARGSDVWVLVIARRLDNPDGSFGGVVAVTLKTEALSQLLAKLRLGPSGIAVLRGFDMTQIARHPHLEGVGMGAGNKTVSQALQERIRERPAGGTYFGTSLLDGVRRILAYRQVENYPFFVNVGRAEDDYLSSWWRRSALLLGLCAAVILITALAARRIYHSSLSSREAALRMQLAIDGANLGIWCLDLADQRVTASERCLALFGLPPGAPPPLDHFLDRLPDDDRQRVELAIAEALRSGGDYRQEYRVILPDGTTTWACAHGRAVRAADGRVVQLHGVVQDITQRKASEQALDASRRQLEALAESLRHANAELRRSEARYANAMEATNDGLWETNLQTGEVFFSPRYSRMLGYEPAELGKDMHSAWLDLVPPDERGQVQAEAERMLGASGHYELEFRMRGKDGRYRWILSRGMVVERDAAGRPLRAVGTHVDLTARKEMEIELRAARDAAEAASHAKTAFLANMSHELRTPMNGIMGLTSLALRRADDPRQIDFLEKIDRSSRQLLGLINDVLEISNIESQRITLDEADFSIEGLLARVHAELGPQAEAKGLTLQLTQPPAITALALRGDEKRLRQVLAKLLDNAIKFTAAGAILLRIEPMHDTPAQLCLRFEIQDSGIGIAPDDIKRLFSAFEQADNSTTRQYGGAGLGLAISKRIVHLMGGQIGVDSTPGEGATFWFTVCLQKGRSEG
ncbi:MAG: PAS domain-containing protein [Zoogloea sp.]|nr:PAS domain-containing protein [Zoogloea sp.]